ncbi:globin [Tessaracoccus sp. OH4464_COT-324]|uniref:globin n=1 Tax=Tessaracoccus sp. OH4464_COT-324 TaxID=2491059 RepID=UPI000F633B9F|nr:globin [Tessaracoccus sp. OH4464_COT-324]RRD46619.1 globin [Tessaracoccus sp. OH4464_COT-324]
MEESFFDRVGGHETFARLTREFYRGVAQDPLLKEMYPEEDLGPAEERLRLFLEQYWGGPSAYHELRGHPRLRIRHAPFKVTPTAAARWLHHMSIAVDTLGLSPDDDRELREYLTRAAQFLINADD